MKFYKLLKYRLIAPVVFTFLFVPNGLGQDLNHVKKIITDLCSEKFVGRGYSNNGDSLASVYIAKALKKSKIKNFSGEYYQSFQISVNTFPGKMKVAINDSLLIPGYDYIVSANSNSIEGKFPLIVMDHNLIDYPDNFKNISTDSISRSFILVDTVSVKNKGFKDAASSILHYNLLGAKGVIEVENKNLMYGPSNNVFPFPKIFIQRNSLSEHMKTISVSIENKFYENYLTRNLVGYLPGKVDSFIVFTAHYDHLGEMGKGIYFPGANDNASGTAMVLELARYFAKNKQNTELFNCFYFLQCRGIGFSRFFVLR